MAKLTDLQTAFLNQLFSVAMGDIDSAAKAVGISDVSQIMTDELLSEMKRRADNQIVLNSAKAVYTLQKILASPESFPFMDKVAKIAGDVLDRAGLSKQDRSVQGATNVGLVFLPTLKPLPENPDEARPEDSSTPEPVVSSQTTDVPVAENVVPQRDEKSEAQTEPQTEINS